MTNDKQNEKPRMKAFRFSQKLFIEYTDRERFVFKIVGVAPRKYRIGVCQLHNPEIVIGVLPKEFSPLIRRQFYRSIPYLSQILIKIAQERGWSEYNE